MSGVPNPAFENGRDVSKFYDFLLFLTILFTIQMKSDIS
jgi:hypothetical protein